MPENRYYIVEQTRQVKVQANTLVGASQVGNAVLHGRDIPEGVYGRAISAIQEREITVKVDP